MHGIGWAVKQMWEGWKVTRAAWIGRGWFIQMQRPDPNSKMTKPYVFITTEKDERVPWAPSQEDLFALDWESAV